MVKKIRELQRGDKAYYFNQYRNCLIEFEVDDIRIGSGFFTIYIKGDKSLNYKRGLPPLGAVSVNEKYYNRTASKKISTVNSNESIKEMKNNSLSEDFYRNNKLIKLWRRQLGN
jgi:hypothetical protein